MELNWAGEIVWGAVQGIAFASLVDLAFVQSFAVIHALFSRREYSSQGWVTEDEEAPGRGRSGWRTFDALLAAGSDAPSTLGRGMRTSKICPILRAVMICRGPRDIRMDQRLFPPIPNTSPEHLKPQLRARKQHRIQWAIARIILWLYPARMLSPWMGWKTQDTQEPK